MHFQKSFFVRNSIYMNYFFEPFNLLVCKGSVDKRNSKVFDVMVLRNDEFNTLVLGAFLWKVYVIVELGERDVVLSRHDDDGAFLLKFCQNVELEMIETLKMKQRVKTNSQVHPDQFTMSSDEIHHKTHIHEPDVVEVDEDSSVQNIDHVGSTTISSTTMQANNSGDAFLFINSMYKNMSSYQSHNYAFQSKEVEDIDAFLCHLRLKTCINQIYMRVMKWHMRKMSLQSVDCSHLGSGSFESTSVTGYSDPFISRLPRGSMEEALVETDAPVIEQSDTRKFEYYGDELVSSVIDGNAVHRTSRGVFEVFTTCGGAHLAGAKTYANIHLGAETCDLASGEEFYEGAGLRVSYTITSSFCSPGVLFFQA